MAGKPPGAQCPSLPAKLELCAATKPKLCGIGSRPKIQTTSTCCASGLPVNGRSRVSVFPQGPRHAS